MKHVNIWTDGSCNTETKQGGWGSVLKYGEHTKLLRGKCSNTTNNRMEMTALLNSLVALKFPCRVHIYTDSMIVISGLKHLREPKRYKPKANMDIWEQIWPLVEEHEWEVEWIPGHAGVMENEIADRLACYYSN